MEKKSSVETIKYGCSNTTNMIVTTLDRLAIPSSTSKIAALITDSVSKYLHIEEQIVTTLILFT